MIFAILVAVLLGAVLTASYWAYRVAFYVPRNHQEDIYHLPSGAQNSKHQEKMRSCIKKLNDLPYESVTITSQDGKTLFGRYYHTRDGAPVQIQFHGYRGSAQRDLAGGVQRCFGVGRSALLVDQRCSGKSGGHVITFGVREHRDCLTWVDFLRRHFGPDVKIILTGISMGAATVLMAGGHPLPDNVIGILADCGFSSARDIIKKVIRQMGIPAELGYPFVKLGARIYGGFDLEETSPMEMVKQCTLPVIFYHGETDDFVPCDMSRQLYDACTSRKQLITVPGAGHGLSFPVDQEYYLQTLREFFGPEASWQK